MTGGGRAFCVGGDIIYVDAPLGSVTFASADMREAVASFREKREGEFHTP